MLGVRNLVDATAGAERLYRRTVIWVPDLLERQYHPLQAHRPIPGPLVASSWTFQEHRGGLLTIPNVFNAHSSPLAFQELQYDWGCDPSIFAP